MMVPAVTTSPSSNLVRANSLASASVAKVWVDRGLRLLTNVPLLGTSNVTYQVWVIHPLSGNYFDENCALLLATCALLDMSLKRSFSGSRSVDPDQRAGPLPRFINACGDGRAVRRLGRYGAAIVVRSQRNAIRLSSTFRSCLILIE